jgi:hypothetical protein
MLQAPWGTPVRFFRGRYRNRGRSLFEVDADVIDRKMGALIYFDFLPKMSVSKRSDGSGFQILLKACCAMIVVEADSRHNSLSILGSVGRAALIVVI